MLDKIRNLPLPILEVTDELGELCGALMNNFHRNRAVRRKWDSCLSFSGSTIFYHFHLRPESWHWWMTPTCPMPISVHGIQGHSAPLCHRFSLSLSTTWHSTPQWPTKTPHFSWHHSTDLYPFSIGPLDKHASRLTHSDNPTPFDVELVTFISWSWSFIFKIGVIMSVWWTWRDIKHEKYMWKVFENCKMLYES